MLDGIGWNFKKILKTKCEENILSYLGTIHKYSDKNPKVLKDYYGMLRNNDVIDLLKSIKNIVSIIRTRNIQRSIFMRQRGGYIYN